MSDIRFRHEDFEQLQALEASVRRLAKIVQVLCIVANQTEAYKVVALNPMAEAPPEGDNVTPLHPPPSETLKRIERQVFEILDPYEIARHEGGK